MLHLWLQAVYGIRCGTHYPSGGIGRDALVRLLRGGMERRYTHASAIVENIVNDTLVLSISAVSC